MFHPIEDPEPPSTHDLAFRSVDEVVNALYASISFDDGTRPDWTTFRRLFEPGARGQFWVKFRDVSRRRGLSLRSTRVT